jgi:hypothetical protein
MLVYFILLKGSFERFANPFQIYVSFTVHGYLNFYVDYSIQLNLTGPKRSSGFFP